MKKFLPFLVMMFLSMNASAWTRVENFNNGLPGDKAEASGAFDRAAGNTIYTNNPSRNDSTVVRMSIEKDKTAYGKWGGILDFPKKLGNGDELWISLYMKVPEDFDVLTPGNGSLKFLRLRTTQHYYDFQIMDDNTSRDAVYRAIKEGIGADWTYIGDRKDLPQLFPRGRWFKIELYVALGAKSVNQGGKGRVRLWINDKFVFEGNDERTLVAPSDQAESLFMFTYWNGGAPKSQSLYVDNIYMTSDNPGRHDNQGHPYIGPSNGSASSPPGAPGNVTVSSD